VGINLSEIEESRKYRVETKGHGTFEVAGSLILSAICPACGGSGQISKPGAEPQLCEVCEGMGMFDYSQAIITIIQ
jgi:DnaJ-class molecular chaperone